MAETITEADESESHHEEDAELLAWIGNAYGLDVRLAALAILVENPQTSADNVLFDALDAVHGKHDEADDSDKPVIQVDGCDC